MSKVFFLIAVLGAASAHAAKPSPFAVGELVTIRNGSQLTIRLGGKNKRVRVYGALSPAGDQLFAKEAIAFAQKLLKSKPLLVQLIKPPAGDAPEAAARICVPRNPKRIKRPADWSRVSKKCLGEGLLDNGLAWRYGDDKPPKDYAKWQREAKKSAYGLWNRPNPTPPWTWRKMSQAARRKHLEETKRVMAQLEKAATTVGAALKKGRLPKALVPKAGLVVAFSGYDRQTGNSKGARKLSFAQLKRPFTIMVRGDGKGWNAAKKDQKPFTTSETFSLKKKYNDAEFSWNFKYRKLAAEATLDASESVDLHFKRVGKGLQLIRLTMSSDDPG